MIPERVPKNNIFLHRFGVGKCEVVQSTEPFQMFLYKMHQGIPKPNLKGTSKNKLERDGAQMEQKTSWRLLKGIRRENQKQAERSQKLAKRESMGAKMESKGD